MKHEVQVFRQKKRIRLLWITSPILASLLFFTEPAWVIGDIRNDIVRQIGAIALFTCISGRCWAALHIGGLKNQQLITSGPYAFTRNPLYFFSSLGLAGVGLAVGSVTLGAIFFCFSYLSFSYVIRQEEGALEQFFQEEYRSYLKSVPRFFPLPRNNSFNLPSADDLPKKAEMVEKTYRQALPFLAAIPLYNLVRYVQDSNIISPIFKLY